MPEPFSASDWERYAEWYDCLNELSPYAEMLQEVARAVKETGALPILDAGCGTGNAALRLTASGIAPESIAGIDSSGAMLERARAKCAGARFLKGDLDAALPFEDGDFGCVICVNALYALEKPTKSLQEFFRVLGNGGALAVATPKSGYQNGLILKAHCKSDKPDAYWTGIHQSPEKEEALLREAVHDEEAARRMLYVAETNRRIAHEKRFHFFEKRELEDALARAGFLIESYEATYARQSHLFVARKP